VLGYTYIRISQFQETTFALLVRAIESSYRENQGNLKGLILDLRNNPGGVLNACVGVSAVFLSMGALVTNIDGRTESSRLQLSAVPEHYFRGRASADPVKKLPPSVKTVPMVVLVNHATAACPEIVAAALQDHKRATILGVRTFGQGTVSTILPMRDKTALKLTTARFYRPSGGEIAGKGVTPDTILEEDKLTSASFGTAEDLQLIQAVKQLGGQPTLSK
jgi:carboxyl-terminal processing protease